MGCFSDCWLWQAGSCKYRCMHTASHRPGQLCSAFHRQEERERKDREKCKLREYLLDTGFADFMFSRRMKLLLLKDSLRHTSTFISHRCTYVLSLQKLPPTCHPSRLSQSPGLCSPSHTANSHWLSILYIGQHNTMKQLSFSLK